MLATVTLSAPRSTLTTSASEGKKMHDDQNRSGAEDDLFGDFINHELDLDEDEIEAVYLQSYSNLRAKIAGLAQQPDAKPWEDELDTTLTSHTVTKWIAFFPAPRC